MTDSAVGFRVKSGWASMVVVSGSLKAPEIVVSQVVQLADPEIPDSTQPFHVALELPGPKGIKEAKRLCRIVERYTDKQVRKALSGFAREGYRIRGVGIVAGSLTDPASIKNDHIRAHAEEGKLFRVVVEQAAAAQSLSTVAFAEKDVMLKAVEALDIPDRLLKQMLAVLGKTESGVWRAEQKLATLAALIVLHQSSGKSHRRAGA